MTNTNSQRNGVNNNDWRVRLFGPNIQWSSCGDQDTSHDEESQDSLLLSTQQVFDATKYDHIAVFFGADYCPHCKDFAPTVVSSAPILEKTKRTKVIFVSNDRDLHSFQVSYQKVAGIDVMPYDLNKTRVMRDMFGLTTIPALVILRNSNFEDSEPKVVTNARQNLAVDPKCKEFPWIGTENPRPQSDAVHHETLSVMDRLIIRGKYGKWWQLGHHNINPSKPDEMYMDEHAVRARAGILNSLTWIALVNVFFWKDPIVVKILFPLVAGEFMFSIVLGLTPLAPIGLLGTLLSIALHPEPLWKPARPKRFAWMIGLTLAIMCLVVFTQRQELGETAFRPFVTGIILMCNVATWLESSCGFCLGCFIYNSFLVPRFKLEECQECKL